MKKQDRPLTRIFEQAKKVISNNQLDQARDLLDLGIATVANYYLLDKKSPKDKVEKTTLDIWMERFWYQLELNNLILD